MKIKPTWTQSFDHFIQFLLVGEGIGKFMKKDRLSGGDRKQPFVLAIGGKLNLIQTFLIFEIHCIETNSILKAVDICFKLIYILNFLHNAAMYGIS
ncbi:unnamed protein product [Larinioides sclopetarius]|uniref:LAGLIDADG homing endonuclease n=1 Tax=Larinioides sclopetarius TaxID=280406 RepID=A0AAV2AT45_9ARAC